MITLLDAIHYFGFAERMVVYRPLWGDKVVTWHRNGKQIAHAYISPVDAEIHIYGNCGPTPIWVDYTAFYDDEARRLFRFLVTLAVSSN